MELATELSMAQESTINNAVADQLIVPVMECLSSQYNPDMILNAMTCLTQIIDLCPNVCAKIVALNGVPSLVDKLFDMTYIELAESVIKALEKIALENPCPILQANGLLMIFMTLPFMNQLTQRKILKISLSLIRSVTSVTELDAFVLPILQNIILSFAENRNLLDDISEVIEMICGCVLKLYKYTSSNIGNIRMLFDKIFSKEFTQAMLKLVCTVDLSDKVLNIRSFESLMNSLMYGIKFCSSVLQESLSSGILYIVDKIISMQFDYIDIATSISEAVLPKKYLINAADPTEKDWLLLETEKEEVWKKDCNEKWIRYIASKLLPLLISLFEEQSTQGIKLQCVQSVIKIIELCPDKEIIATIESSSFARMMYIILDSSDPLFTSLGLLMLEKSLKVKCNVIHYIKKEGIECLLKKVLATDYTTKLKAIQTEKLWVLSENAFVKYFSNCVGVSIKDKTAHQLQFLAKYIDVKSNELLPKITEINLKEVDQLNLHKIVSSFNNGTVTNTEIGALAQALNTISHFEFVNSGLLESIYHLLIPSKPEESKGGDPHYDKKHIANAISAQGLLLNGLFNSQSKSKCSLVILIELLQSLLYSIDKPSLELMLNDLSQSSSFAKPNKQVKICLKYYPIFPGDKKSPIKISEDEHLSKFYKEKCEIFTEMNSLTVLVDIYKPFSILKKFILNRLSSREEVAYIKEKKSTEGLVQLLGSIDKTSEIYKKIESLINSVPHSEHLIKVDETCDSEMLLIPFNRTTSVQPNISSQDPMGNIELSLGMRNMSANSPPHTLNETQIMQSFDIELMYNGKPVSQNTTFYDVLSKYNADKSVPAELTNMLLFKVIRTSIGQQNNITEYSKAGIGNVEEREIQLLNYIYNFKLEKPFVYAGSLLLLIYNLTVPAKSIYFNHTKAISIEEQIFVNKKLSSNMIKLVEDTAFAINSVFPDWAKQISSTFTPLLPFEVRNLLLKLKYMNKQRFLMLMSSYFHHKGYKNIDMEALMHQLPRNKIKANRKSILNYATLITSNIQNINTIVEFDFENEEGTGLGPTLEFYQTCIQSIFDIKELWRATGNNLYFPSPFSSTSAIKHKTLDLFQLLGVLTARAILDDRVIELPLSSLFWDVLLSHSLCLADMQRLDPTLYNTLHKINEYRIAREQIINNPKLSKEDKNAALAKIKIYDKNIEDLGVYCILPGYENVELVEKGSKTLLTSANTGDYLQKLIECTFASTVSKQVEAYKKGFESILPLKAFDLFNSHEIEEYFNQTTEAWTEGYLRENIKADHGYNESSPQLSFLIQYMLSLDSITKKKFIKYVTGATRLPKGGLLALNPKLTIVKKVNDDKHLPSVMTCQNYLKIPEYKSYAILRDRFNYAICEGQESFSLT